MHRHFLLKCSALLSGGLLMTLGAGAWLLASSQSPAAGPAFSQKTLDALKQPPANALRIESQTLKQGNVFYAIIPPGYPILPIASERLQPIERFTPIGHERSLPIAVINAGYFDPSNHKTISYITQSGVLVADPTQNEGLTQNPNLKPYLPQVFNRSEFRVYQCSTATTTQTRYDITPHQAQAPKNCSLQHALGAGPQLLPADRSVEEAVVAYDANGKMIRDPFGVNTANARSAIGLSANGSVILLMGAQDPRRGAPGFTFKQVSSLLASLGAVKALSLDGGSSSAIMLRGLDSQGGVSAQAVTEGSQPEGPQEAMPVIYGKYNKQGQAVRRPIKSVLMVLSAGARP